MRKVVAQRLPAGGYGRAAKLLGISRATLRYRLEKFNIAADNEPDSESSLVEV